MNTEIETKREFETFRKIGSFEESNLTNHNPSCFNGRVSVRKYKVTVELIEEDDQVIRDRIQKLWDECDNYHHRNPLKLVAEKHGLELKY
jgi:hypothetical protein